MAAWTDYLSGEVHDRLSNCKTVKADVIHLARAMWKHVKCVSKMTKEEVLDSVLEILNFNGCGICLTQEEYRNILSLMTSDRYELKISKMDTAPKGCELCDNPAKWAAVFAHESRFGFPYLFARTQFFNDGKIRAAYCPMCGRKIKDE